MAQGDPEQSPYEIRGWDSGDDDLAISIRVNGCRFTISISPNSFSNSPVALRLFRNILAKFIAGEDGDPEVWDYSEQVADVFLPEFKRLAPPVVHTGKLTLADLAPRGAFECEYCVIDERPLAVGITERVPEIEPIDEWNIRKIQSAFPVFDPREVEVPYDEGHRIYDIIPQRVIVNGQQFFYKSSWSPSDPIDEIGKYVKIKASNPPLEHLHMSRLFGIVAYPNGQTKGLLYEWIETGRHGTLWSVMKSDTPLSTRQKWAGQIRETVAALHELGVVWGDVKPDNVLIDNDNNAVVIDLEGGTTRGWVDHDVGGTLEGDMQGMERMMDFIFNDESPLRLGASSDTGYSEDMDED
ncbi:hypothetical protein N0V84_007498 [Fusarium piperis]|uniref:Protein kinase domain-containing protein n=1 Tax=Fusarium piperis TaxID=1435070 RepID=A0A9W9BLG1_9HYPO|nr:hypothetical protein N0V84_007498 [Fusarium piperis]